MVRARERARFVRRAVFARSRGAGSENGVTGTGFGFTTGAFVGWAFQLVGKLDVRVGAGAQYIGFHADPYEASTPFVALDLVLAYRRQ